MFGFEKNLIRMSRRFWRYRWHGLLMAWGIAIAGWGWIATLPNRYEATAQVYVNAGTPLETLRSRIYPDRPVFSVADIVEQSLMDEQRLSSVINAVGPLRGSSSRDDREKTVNKLLEQIEITTSAKWKNLFRISYSDSSQKKAVMVIEAFIATIEEDAMRAGPPGQNDQPNDQNRESVLRFRLVDPPGVALADWPPYRPALIVVMLLVGLAAGAALLSWLDSRKPVFHTAEQVSAITGVPDAGIIAHARINQATAQLRQELGFFLAGAIAFFLCFALALLI